jgi:hypothetical protein
MKRALFLSLLLGGALAACGSPSNATSGSAGAGASASGGAGGSGASASGGAGAGGSGGTTTSSTTPSTGGSGGATTSGEDALASSFVYVGCNRLSKGDWDVATNPSSANVPQLLRTFADVAGLADVPQHFFFAGDLVLGLDKTNSVLTGQLDAWAGLHASDPSGIAKKVPLVPLPGNHEMLYKTKLNGTSVELSNHDADKLWKAWTAAHGFDANAGNGPTGDAPNPDALVDDQSRMSYSFDAAGVHYVVLNTDTWTTTPDDATGDTQIGWIPMSWLKADLAAAQASAAVSHIVVLGHKPVVSPDGMTTSDAAINPAFTAELELLVDTTTKVRGYFCAHSHLWDARKLPGNRGVYQVIAGNGGSAVESFWMTPFYGFTQVRIYQSGKVGVVSFQRPVPATYDQPPAEPAVPQPELVISP